jgi:hypothetical protein
LKVCDGIIVMPRDITLKVMPMGLDAISRLSDSLSPGVFEDNPEPEV